MYYTLTYLFLSSLGVDALQAASRCISSADFYDN